MNVVPFLAKKRRRRAARFMLVAATVAVVVVLLWLRSALSTHPADPGDSDADPGPAMQPALLRTHGAPRTRAPQRGPREHPKAQAQTHDLDLDGLRQTCRQLSDEADEDAIVTLPAHVWTVLRVRSAAAAAADTCASSRWPLRRALRLVTTSALLAPEQAQADGGYLVADLPSAYGRALTAHVPRADACAALEAAESWTTRFVVAGGGKPEPVDVLDATTALCGGPARAMGRLRFDRRRALTPRLLALELPCPDDSTTIAAAAAKSAFSDDAAGPGAAVWRALLHGTLQDGTPLDGTDRVPCGVPMDPDRMRAALAANVAAIHHAVPTVTLQTPAALAAAIRRPVPVGNVVPLLLPNAAELAELAEANDLPALVAALTPPAHRRALPGVVTSFNVMVSPTAVLTALRPAAAAAADATPASGAAKACPPPLAAAFEPEDPSAAARRAAATAAFEEAAVGGAAELARLRTFAPHALLVPYWPPEGGLELDEHAAVASATLEVFNTATPDRDNQPVPHTACDAWDAAAAEAGQPPALLVSEVVVVPHSTTSSSRLHDWVPVDLVGRLQLMAPYLNANPHVRVHIAYAPHRAWANASEDSAPVAWLRAMGLADRLVSGRVLARIAHVLDRVPVGPRAHPLQLLAARDASERVLAAAGYPPLATLHLRQDQPEATPGSQLLLVQSTAPDGRPSVTNLATLSTALTQRRLAPTVWAAAGEVGGSLARTIVAWAAADAVVAPHGAGLANALFMRPGATLIESVPQGHAGSGLASLQLAHVGRLRHHLIVMPGTAETSIGHDLVLVEALLCGDTVNHTVAGWLAGQRTAAALAPFAGGRCGSPSASFLHTRDRQVLGASAPRRRGQLIECLPAPRPPPIRLTALEPVEALAPVPGLVATLPCARRTRYSVPAGDAEAHTVWTSPTSVLPLAEVRAVALVNPAANNDAVFVAVDPSQRGLVRALEAARILPVAMPASLCCDPATLCYVNFTESCGGPHATLLLSLAGAMVRAVAAARGLPPTAIPVITAGLSSGGGTGGLLAAHGRMTAVLSQLAPAPASIMVDVHNASALDANASGHLHNASGRGRPGSAAASCVIKDARPVMVPPEVNGPSTLPAHELAAALAPASPSTPPALWMTGASADEFELRTVTDFAKRWRNVTTLTDSDGAMGMSDRYVFNSWAPTAVTASSLHRTAPWLLSHAAAAAFVQAALAVGVLQVPTKEQWAAHTTYRPWCPRDGTFSDELFDDDDDVSQPGSDAPNLPLTAGEVPLFMPSWNAVPEVGILAVVDLLFWAVEFRASGPVAGEPVFFAASEVGFAGTARFSVVRARTACVYVIGAGTKARTVPDVECRAALKTFAILSGWLRRALKMTAGVHEYHVPPWADIVAWMVRAVDLNKGT